MPPANELSPPLGGPGGRGIVGPSVALSTCSGSRFHCSATPSQNHLPSGETRWSRALLSTAMSDLGLDLGQLLVDFLGDGYALELDLHEIAAADGRQGAEVDQRIDGSRSSLEPLGLLLGAADGHAELRELAGKARQRFVQPDLGLRRAVPRLDHLTMCAELLDPDLQSALLRRESLLVGLDFADVLGESLHLRRCRVLAFERQAREVFAARGDGAAGLVVELRDPGLEPVRLLLQLLLGGGDVHQAAAQADEQLLLLVVCVVEDLPRVLRPVEGAADLRVEEQPEPGPNAHGGLLVEESAGWQRRPKVVSEAVSKRSQFQSHTHVWRQTHASFAWNTHVWAQTCVCGINRASWYGALLLGRRACRPLEASRGVATSVGAGLCLCRLNCSLAPWYRHGSDPSHRGHRVVTFGSSFAPRAQRAPL